MAKVIGNGLTAEFGPSGSALFAIAVTSISMDSADRPVIDITAASDAQRIGVPGLRGVPTGSVTGILTQDDADPGADPPVPGNLPTLIETIEDELTSCALIACRITAKAGDCTTAAPLVDANVHVTGFTIDASIDEAASITVNFMLANGDKFVPDSEG